MAISRPGAVKRINGRHEAAALETCYFAFFAQVVEAALADADLAVSDIDWLLLHQANQVRTPASLASKPPKSLRFGTPTATPLGIRD